MKAIFSTLAEDQTIRTERVNERVAIRVRQCADGVMTRDVMVDGYCYTPHVSEKWLGERLQAIVALVGRESRSHIGMGQWQ